jgi:hypothetical protein
MPKKSASVRISGKRGNVTVEVKPGSTVGDVVREAAGVLGLEGFSVEKSKLMVEGAEVPADTPVEDGTKVDAAPAARLG